MLTRASPQGQSQSHYRSNIRGERGMPLSPNMTCSVYARSVSLSFFLRSFKLCRLSSARPSPYRRLLSHPCRSLTRAHFLTVARSRAQLTCWIFTTGTSVVVLTYVRNTPVASVIKYTANACQRIRTSGHSCRRICAYIPNYCHFAVGYTMCGNSCY